MVFVHTSKIKLGVRESMKRTEDVLFVKIIMILIL